MCVAERSNVGDAQAHLHQAIDHAQMYRKPDLLAAEQCIRDSPTILFTHEGAEHAPAPPSVNLSGLARPAQRGVTHAENNLAGLRDPILMASS